jgi:hypothetical protein
MLKFFKKLFANTKVNQTIPPAFDPKAAAKYYIDHLRLLKDEQPNGLRFAVLTTIDLSAHMDDPGALFDLHVVSVEVAPLDMRAKAYLDSASTGAIKASVATLCYAAGEYSMYETTPIGKEAPIKENTDKGAEPLLPSKDTLLN